MPNRTMRDRLIGLPYENDRLWIIHTPFGEFAITDYNDELTGYSPQLGMIDAETFRYGGNAYYILGPYAQARGWGVECPSEWC